METPEIFWTKLEKTGQSETCLKEDHFIKFEQKKCKYSI